jgi:hypothetical protein
MKSFTKFTAIVLVLVAFCASMTFSVSSPNGRFGVRGVDTGEDHPWGGDQIITDPNPAPIPNPNPGPATMTASSTVIITGQSWFDGFLNRIFYGPIHRHTLHTYKRPVVTPTTPNTGTTTTSAGSGSSN